MAADLLDLFPGGFNFSTWEFESEIDSVLIPTYKAAFERLNAWQKKAEVELRKRLIGAPDEGERGLADSESDWEECMHRSQNRAIGAGALNWVCSRMHSELNRLARHLGAKGYHKGWLWEARDEFRDKFGINFQASPVSFGLIEEIVRARNALVHFEDPDAFNKYTNLIASPRFVAELDYEPYVSVENFCAAADEAKGFIRWVFGEAKRLYGSNEAAS